MRRVLLVTPGQAPAEMELWAAVVERGDVDLAVLGPWSHRSRLHYTFGQELRPLPGTTAIDARVWGRRHHHHDWWWYPDLPAVLRRFRPEVVHVISEPWGLLVRQATRSHPVVLAHGAFTRWEFGGERRSSVRRRVGDRLVPKLAGYVSWNQQGIDAVRAAGLSPGSPTAVIPAVAPPPSTRVANIRADARHVGFVGRLAEEKGLDVLLHALAQLEGRNLALTVVGDGPLRGSLEELAHQLGVDATFLGAVKLGEVDPLLAQFDVLAVPSVLTERDEEQFGRVIVEGMSAGLPIVATRVGAQPAVAGDAAVLVGPGDADELASAIGSLIDDEPRRQQLAATGIERYHRCYAPSVLASDLVATWERALAGARPAGTARG
jgi:glycosyltransferase involved in cell wall biosynthesis